MTKKEDGKSTKQNYKKNELAAEEAVRKGEVSTLEQKIKSTDNHQEKQKLKKQKKQTESTAPSYKVRRQEIIKIKQQRKDLEKKLDKKERKTNHDLKQMSADIAALSPSALEKLKEIGRALKDGLRMIAPDGRAAQENLQRRQEQQVVQSKAGQEVASKQQPKRRADPRKNRHLKNTPNR